MILTGEACSTCTAHLLGNKETKNVMKIDIILRIFHTFHNKIIVFYNHLI